MKLPKGTPILAMDSATFTEDFMAVIGASPGEPIECVAPQFHRADGLQVALPSLTRSEWDNLSKLPSARLWQMGFQVWEETTKGTHWLFPGQWYSHIPNGTKIVCISGDEEIFVKGKTDDDIRCGALAYGFITRKETP